MSACALPCRTLRSGKEFSVFDLALAVCVDFDTPKCLQWRLSEQDHTGLAHEPEDDSSLDLAGLSLVPEIDIVDDALPTSSPAPHLGDGGSGSQSSASPSTPSPCPPQPLPDSLSAKERNKFKSRARCNRKRDKAQQDSVRPTNKAVHQKRLSEAKSNYLEVYYDVNGLPHSVPAWVGNCSTEGLEFVFPDGSPASGIDRGMGGKLYFQAEVDALTGTKGFAYISWLGLLTIAILDSRRRVVALLGGIPKGAEDWAQTPYAAVSRGPSHGGGQTEPGELQQNETNTIITDELLEDADIKRIVSWINLLFFLWVPKLYQFYQQAREALSQRHSLRWNFAKTVFAACTFNFGPQAITRPHLDYGNLSWGWCAVTALGWFDPDLGGHLILWDLRLII
ncbi:hypothetical protein K438DRAFT_2025127 [Mycena galopus ATCC 62051]|nr:hypothetical protein K438DRAFT_2025127 [Mycena galopus ATCC 62051]